MLLLGGSRSRYKDGPLPGAARSGAAASVRRNRLAEAKVTCPAISVSTSTVPALRTPPLYYDVVNRNAMPMERDEAIARLKRHETELKRLGVEHLYLFGSTARGDASPDSDVDLRFDYDQGALGLFQLMDVKERASTILGRKADIMTRDSLHKLLRERIEAGGGTCALMAAGLLVPRLTDTAEAIAKAAPL